MDKFVQHEIVQDQGWVVDRLVKMIRHATQSDPLIYFQPSGQVILLVGKESVPKGPTQLTKYRQLQWQAGETPEALDDWPDLCLGQRAIPVRCFSNLLGAVAGRIRRIFGDDDRDELSAFGRSPPLLIEPRLKAVPAGPALAGR